MSRCVDRFFFVACVLSVANYSTSLFAPTGTWSTTPAIGNNLMSPGNWSSGGPMATTGGTTNTSTNAVDELTFNDSSGSALNQSNNGFARKLLFNGTSTTYTWTANDFNLT